MKKLILAAALGAVATTPALAQDYDEGTETLAESRDGVRIEGRVMWERLNDPQEDVGINYELGSGVSFGGEVGVDFAVSDAGSLRLNARWIDIESDATLNGAPIGTADIDPVILNVAYVHRF